jgi:hypothetical protein
MGIRLRRIDRRPRSLPNLEQRRVQLDPGAVQVIQRAGIVLAAKDVRSVLVVGMAAVAPEQRHLKLIQ